jgi:NitT/TauT family transport system permease protein
MNNSAGAGNISNAFKWGLLVFFLAVGLLLWEGLARAGLISSMFFPAPTAIIENLLQLVEDGTLWGHFIATFKRLIFGLIVGGSLGVILGLVMGWSKEWRSVVDPVIAALHPIPKISILPLIMIIFGIGEISKVIVIALAVFFPMLINTIAGVRHISPIYFEVAQNYGADFRKLFRRVVIPASLPMVTTGLRIALNTALVVTIAVELVVANQGLGAMIWFSWEILRTKDLYASLLFISMVGILSNLILQLTTRLILPWYEPQNQ